MQSYKGDTFMPFWPKLAASDLGSYFSKRIKDCGEHGSLCISFMQSGVIACDVAKWPAWQGEAVDVLVAGWAC